MKAETATNTNPYIDEVTGTNQGANNYNPIFKKASVAPNIDELEDTKAAAATDNAEDFELETEDLVEGDREYESERDTKKDDFTSHNPYRDKHGKQDQDQQQQKRKQRRLGKLGRKEAPEPTREEVFTFLEGMDKMLDTASDAVELKSKNVDKDFENWNNWFKAEKKSPPSPDSSKVFYIREEFNAKRSPHLWKSNPEKRWVLAFGENEVNNVVTANLYKYQNETISKDA